MNFSFNSHLKLRQIHITQGTQMDLVLLQGSPDQIVTIFMRCDLDNRASIFKDKDMKIKVKKLTKERVIEAIQVYAEDTGYWL